MTRCSSSKLSETRRLAPSAQVPHRQFLGLLYGRFIKNALSYKLKHWGLFIGDKINVSINSVSVHVRFYFAQLCE